MRHLKAVCLALGVIVAAAALIFLGTDALKRHAGSADLPPRSHQSPGGPGISASESQSAPEPATHRSRPPVFGIYYLWWDRQHWVARLGSKYPIAGLRNPLPATLDSSGCRTVSRYPGNQVTDVSQGLSYDQSNPLTIQNDVELAAKSGLSGFVVNWIGTGATHQSVTASNYNRRLKYMFDAVHRVNAQGYRFSLILNYQSSAKLLSLSQFGNDFRYFLSAYGRDPALDHSYSSKPEVVMAGTWKYSDDELTAISATFRAEMYLVGDEKPSSWDQARAESLDGTSYYWSSQDPVKNKSSFDTLTRFAATIRKVPNPDGRPKTWLAPFTPGYNAMLLYHTSTCVPRNDGRTMRELFAGNAASDPDGWTLISWNEISEGSYVVPLTRYGTLYTDTLRILTRAARYFDLKKSARGGPADEGR